MCGEPYATRYQLIGDAVGARAGCERECVEDPGYALQHMFYKFLHSDVLCLE